MKIQSNLQNKKLKLLYITLKFNCDCTICIFLWILNIFKSRDG